MHMKTLFLVAALLALGSRSITRTEAQPPTVIWHSLGTWSGQVSTQTESFDIDGFSWRVRWRNRAGHLVLSAHSAISGRPIALAVDHTGAGEGVAYITDDPRLFFVQIDSDHADYWFTVEVPLIRRPDLSAK
jgi:hypothetical protein